MVSPTQNIYGDLSDHGGHGALFECNEFISDEPNVESFGHHGYVKCSYQKLRLGLNITILAVVILILILLSTQMTFLWEEKQALSHRLDSLNPIIHDAECLLRRLEKIFNISCSEPHG